jgi:hypothetical protein
VQENEGRWGGGLWVGTNNTVFLFDSSISHNSAIEHGGGVRLFGGRVVIDENSHIDHNEAPVGGGISGIASGGFRPTLDLYNNSTILANSALEGYGVGGGVYLTEGEIHMGPDTRIMSNDALQGGGLYLDSTTMHAIGSCRIDGNYAGGHGGGIYALSSAIVLRNDVLLVGNRAGIDGAGNGGGAYLANAYFEASGCSISSNAAFYGAGLYTVASFVRLWPLLSGCDSGFCSVLSYNIASNYGGGIFMSEGSEAELVATAVESNSASYGGGLYANSSSAVLESVLLYRNDSTLDVGAAIRLFNGASLEARGSTIAYNEGGGGTSGHAIAVASSDLTIEASIIWGHTSTIDGDPATVSCSDVEGGYTGPGNLNVDPQFVSWTSGDLHLDTGSPLIDACTPLPLLIDIDVELRPWVTSSSATPTDMGCDEYGSIPAGIFDDDFESGDTTMWSTTTP